MALKWTLTRVKLILFLLSSTGQRGDAVWSSDNAEDGDSRGEADCSLQTVWGDPLSSPQVELEKLPHARCILKYSSCKTFRVVTGILTFRFSTKKPLKSFQVCTPLCNQGHFAKSKAASGWSHSWPGCSVFIGQSSPLPSRPPLPPLRSLLPLPPSLWTHLLYKHTSTELWSLSWEMRKHFESLYSDQALSLKTNMLRSVEKSNMALTLSVMLHT